MVYIIPAYCMYYVSKHGNCQETKFGFKKKNNSSNVSSYGCEQKGCEDILRKANMVANLRKRKSLKNRVYNFYDLKFSYSCILN